ncbi:HAMP domain-containing sensor histidine kinase [uncultured Tateyamaria sp.]|uniref:sensor histidine kinase n=1 Tax=Tateyamaria sp. 1078 TaxID=3417464 RepID=UPI00260E3367|nr:HAMP domain-containing sensor histidine kinase [uncultured Tateyamaria sp.]
MPRVRRKWRPPLALILGGTLGAVFLMPLLGMVYLRLWGNVLGWGEAAWLILWLAFAATSVLAVLLWRLVLRPVTALTRYAQAKKRGDDAQAPDQFGTPELGRLATSVMAMGDSLNSRAEGLRAYAGHVTHELKSPLTAIRGAAELLQADPSPEDRAALSSTISEAAARMQTLLDDLARHARASESAGPGAARLTDAMASLDTPVTVTVAEDAVLPMAAEDIRTVLTQLIHNAAEHGATEVTLLATPHRLAITDNGPGISAGNRDRVFDPFFTTRREGGGTGMGLSIVRSLVEARGGRIRLDESAGGATFVIAFDD